MPPNVRSGPGGGDLQSRRGVDVTATVPDSAMVTQGAVTVRQRFEPTAYASVYLPQGHRTWVWMTFRCPVCRTFVFARCRQIDDVTSSRRTTCGHRVRPVAARLYGQPEAA